MREILYLQAGTFANHTGTHFWNTQDAYQVINPDMESPVDHDISFTERHGSDGTSTLYPRALIFDWKDNFGTLAQSSALTGTDETQPPETHHVLDRPVDEFRQTRIGQSAYHARMEEETSDLTQPQSSSDIRYWSDYSHVYWLPRSIQRLPNPPSRESLTGDWKRSQERFLEYNKDNDLMDTSIRLFLEESDIIQGVQLINDVSSFGGFSAALLVQLQDEFVRAPTLTFPILSANLAQIPDIDDHQRTHEIINEALYLRSLEEQASITVPVGMPQHWPETAWIRASAPRSTYFSSSILSAHVEAATFSCRTKISGDHFSNLAMQLSASGLPSIAELSGVLPVDESTNFGHSLVNYSTSALDRSKDPVLFSIRDVIRGFGSLTLQKYEGWISKTVKDFLPETLRAPKYPLTEPLRATLGSKASDTANMLSRLSTSSALPHMFKHYASFVETSLRHRAVGIVSMGLDGDDIRELVNDLWTVHDRYPPDQDSPEPSLEGSDRR